MLKISTGTTKVDAWESPMPLSPKRWIRSAEMSTSHSPPRPISPKKWFHSTEMSARHSPPRHACKFPTPSPHWPATMDAIQNDDPEEMLTLLKGIKDDLTDGNAQVVMHARTHLSTTK